VNIKHLMKQLSLLVISSFFLLSCQKELSHETSTNTGGSGTGGGGGNNSYYIRAKVNGSDRSFNYNDMAKVTDLGGGSKTISLIGSASPSATNLEGINLTISFLNGSPVAGTYNEDNQSLDYIVAGVYNPNSSTVVYAAGLSATTALPLSVTISKIDNTVAEGTFKGAFYKTDISSGGPGTEYLSFTEGAFRLPIK
jgi:hypothetical protein